MSNNLHRRVSFGLFDFDVVAGELRKDGAPVKLAPQPARVLALLVSRPGEVILRDEFRRELWGDQTFVDFERGLNFSVTQARAALGDSSDNPRFIQTVPRRGYRFIAPVALSNHTRPSAEPAAGNGDSPRAEGLSPRPGTVPESVAMPVFLVRRWAVIAVAIATVAVFAWWISGERPSSGTIGRTSALRVAVLPIANLTGDTTADYLADALTDDVISELGALGRHRLGVIARTSAMRYRGTDKTIQEIGRELGVQYVVESSLRRVGSGLRIASSIVPVTEQAATTWWNDVFDAASTSVETQQTYAAIRMARRVAMELLPDADHAFDARTTSNLAAWEAFLRASAAIGEGTPADIRRAVGQLEEATRHDSGFAAAWARLAEAQHLLVMMGAVPPGDAYPTAQHAAERALAAAPSLAAAHLAQGLVQLWYEWRPDAAAASFARALERNHSLAAAHHDYAWALVALGRTDDAIRHITTSRDLDPLSTRANNDVGWLYLHVRQPVDAARACQHTLAIDPGALEAQACLERAYTQRQLFDAALQAARTTLQGYEDTPARATNAAAGLREIWNWRLRQLERASQTRWINPHTLAVHYTLTGETERAVTALEDAYAKRVGMMVFLAHDPAMDPLRGHPRFESLIRKVNGTAR